MGRAEVKSGVIMVINRALSKAENLKELIEFMDVPEVRSSTPDQWRKHLDGQRLSAVFVGSDLDDSEVREVVRDVGALDPNVQIVMLHEGD